MGLRLRDVGIGGGGAGDAATAPGSSAYPSSAPLAISSSSALLPTLQLLQLSDASTALPAAARGAANQGSIHLPPLGLFDDANWPQQRAKVEPEPANSTDADGAGAAPPVPSSVPSPVPVIVTLSGVLGIVPVVPAVQSLAGPTVPRQLSPSGGTSVADSEAAGLPTGSTAGAAGPDLAALLRQAQQALQAAARVSGQTRELAQLLGRCSEALLALPSAPYVDGSGLGWSAVEGGWQAVAMAAWTPHALADAAFGSIRGLGSIPSLQPSLPPITRCNVMWSTLHRIMCGGAGQVQVQVQVKGLGAVRRAIKCDAATLL